MSPDIWDRLDMWLDMSMLQLHIAFMQFPLMTIFFGLLGFMIGVIVFDAFWKVITSPFKKKRKSE